MRAFRVTVPEADEDLATALLWEAGTAGLEVTLAPGGKAVLLAYFEGDASFGRLVECVPGAEVEPVAIPDVDWVARFRETFRSFRVGRFSITPPWESPGETAETLIIDPGRAFGTGTHESTRLCLGALESLAGRRDLGRAIDIGTGTGILAVAAARLGASPVVASDTDPDALASARVHAGLNRVSLQLVQADGPGPFRPGQADLVLANITAPLLAGHAEGLAGLRTPGGVLVLSGILEEDLSTVTEAYGFCGRPEVRHDGEWVALVYEGAR